MKYLHFIVAFFLMLHAGEVCALSPDTLQNLGQLEEKLEEHVEDGFLQNGDLIPLVVVEVSAESEDKQTLTNALLQSLNRSLKSKVMYCESCQSNFQQSTERDVYETGFADLDRIRAVYKGQKGAPKAALWARQADKTLSVRIVSLQSAAVLFADTIDSRVEWTGRSLRSFTQSRRAERQARGDVIIHGHIDIGIGLVGGGAHLGYSLMQQWGESNNYLSGLSFNLTDPVLGIGVNTFRVMPGLNNALLGGKVLVSLPEAIGKSVNKNDSNRENSSDTFVLVLMMKYPLFGEPEKFYGDVFISSSGLAGLGFSW